MSLKSRFIFILGSLSFVAACATVSSALKDPFVVAGDIEKPAPFIEHTGTEKMQSYLAMNLNYPPAEGVRQDLEKRLRIKLINRGEAHITVISPVEYDNALSAKITIQRINEIATAAAMQLAPIQYLCVGRGSANLNGRGEQTYFMVVKSPRLLEIRKAVRDAFVKAGGDAAAFNPDQFYPHVTLGFTKRDLHFEDGVVKDEGSCLAPVVKTP